MKSGSSAPLAQLLMHREGDGGCIEGFNLRLFSVPQAKKHDTDLREFHFLEACLLEYHPLTSQKVFLAS